MSHFVDPNELKQAILYAIEAQQDGSLEELVQAAWDADRAITKMGRGTSSQHLSVWHVKDIIRNVFNLPDSECEKLAIETVLGSPLQARMDAAKEHIAELKRRRQPRPETPLPKPYLLQDAVHCYIDALQPNGGFDSVGFGSSVDAKRISMPPSTVPASVRLARKLNGGQA